MSISFKYRFIVSFVLLEVIFLSMIVTVNFKTIENNMDSFLAYQEKTFIALANQLLVTPISVYDLATLDNIANEFTKLDEVKAFKIWDIHQKLLSQSIVGDAQTLSKYATIEHTIQTNGIKLGKVQIWFDLQSHKESISENKLITFLIVLIEILFSTLISWIIGRSLARNFELLTQSAENVSKNLEKPVPFIKGVKEIEIFSRTLEEMREKLNEDRIIIHKAQKEAEQGSVAKSQFLANMSHEIRTPMNAIFGFINQLEKTEKDASRLEMFQIIKGSGETLLSIINDILDISKIESGKIELENEAFNLHESLVNAAVIFEQLASVKNISFARAISDDVPECIYGDETRLKQVIFNLMSNAIKFTQSGGQVSLHAHYKDQKKSLYIAVTDTGIGISKENFTKIFQAFDQEDLSTTRKFGGTGLGLTISSRLVELMGGRLQLESEVGEGSKFYFEISAEECTKKLTSKEESLKNDHQSSFKGDVLIVEDNKTNQLLMSMILDDYGVTYDLANDGAEGVLKAKLKHYDLILMDENMPMMNGIEATKIIREKELKKSAHTPIVAVTANALIDDRQRFLDAGMDDHIAKPYTEEQIVAVLKKYLH